MTAAMPVWRRATHTPMSIDLRVPSTTRAKTSRPPWVVPNQCPGPGGVRKAVLSTSA